MKLKQMLFLTFLILSFIPISIVSLLLYRSGYDLSKESYANNLAESINVQADYIAQTIENDMVSDYRFAKRCVEIASEPDHSSTQIQDELLVQFRNYLENSEDKVTLCALLNQANAPLYTIGEKGAWEHVVAQLPDLSTLKKQTIVEFDLGGGEYSLGILTPVLDNQQQHLGSLISVYNKSYVFKTISSYYEMTDTSTYICRSNGEIINARGTDNPQYAAAVAQLLTDTKFEELGRIESDASGEPMLGQYRKLYNSPWVLVGIVDNSQVYAFLNQFVWVYLLLIAVVCVLDAFLAAYFSSKVVRPINSLIQVMDGYPESMLAKDSELEPSGYYETQYLRSKFFTLMHTIQRVSHNFDGFYLLYQSSAMGDTNIEINNIEQTIHSNKEVFEILLRDLVVPPGACIVERFTRCFIDKDQVMLMEMFENMRDQHLAVTQEVEVFTPHLGEKWFHILVVPMYEDSRLSRLFIQLRDISSFKKQELQSNEQAKRDTLTGLYNRGGFSAYVDQVLAKNDLMACHGLLFIDINDFKLVNDNLGHKKGDDLLCLIGELLQEASGEGAVVSRFGGDEFAIFLPNTTMPQLGSLEADILRKLVFPYQTGGTSFVITASVGISTWSVQNPRTLEQLLQQADEAMYTAKRACKHEAAKLKQVEDAAT